MISGGNLLRRREKTSRERSGGGRYKFMYTCVFWSRSRCNLNHITTPLTPPFVPVFIPLLLNIYGVRPEEMSAPSVYRMPPPARRHPLTDVNNPQKQHVAQEDPPKLVEKPKEPGSPPLPRQNSKITPPSPPRVIVDRNRDAEFLRIGLLGEGGFARVYEIQDKRGSKSACKVVTKSSLKTKKAKTKVGVVLNMFADRIINIVCSFMQKSRYTRPYLIQTSFDLTSVSKTMKMST